MLEFVNELLNSQDNIIDQLKVLRENKNHKEVKKYIKALVKENNSPYFVYCINTYYFNKNVAEVKPPISALHPIYSLKGSKKINELLDSKDSIIDQIKLLKERKGNKNIDNFVEHYLLWANQYETYCINKYYYDMDVEEVKPTAKSLNIKLYKIYFPSLEKKQEQKKQKTHLKAIKKCQKGDKVKILDGPFENLIGTITSFDEYNLKLFLTIELFDGNYEIEHDGKFELIKEDKNGY